MKIIRRIRFSLASLLLFVLFAASLIGLKMSRSEVEQLREQNKELRQQLGVLEVEDRSMVYVKQQISHADLEWRWRVYLPPGHGYHIRMDSGQIEESGFAKFGGHHDLKTLPDGEFTLVVRLFKNDGLQKGWVLSADWGAGTLRLGLEPEVGEWIDKKLVNLVGTMEQFGPTFYFDPAENDQVELLRKRKGDYMMPTPTKVVPGPSTGFLIWLETYDRFKKDNPSW